MAFGDLKTDEKVEASARERGMDDFMLRGCSSFGLLAIASYGLGTWAYLVFQTPEVLSSLLWATGLGPGILLLGTILVGRRAGLAGLCGWIAGTMASCLFLFLRLQSLFRDAHIGASPPPAFREEVVWFLPLGILAAVLGTSIIALPRSRES